MTEWFPSREWLESYREQLRTDETYADASEGWGVDFDGDFLFVLTRLPLEETTLAELPDDLTDDLADRIEELPDDEFAELRESATQPVDDRMDDADGNDDRERFRQALFATTLADVPDVVWPALEELLEGDLDSLLDQLETYVTDEMRVHAHIELEDGDCLGADLVADPSAVDPGFRLEADYETWVDLVEGADVIGAVMSNEMALDGSVTRVLHYDTAAAAMGDVAGETDARYLF